MKIYLTSQANLVLDKITADLPKKPNEYKLAFIPTAGDLYEEKPWQEADRAKLIELGFGVEDFDLKNKTESEVRSCLKNIDIIFVAGGNTFYLLQKANESGFAKVIKELKNSDKIYIGSSAGSCIAGPDIEAIAQIDDPQDAPGLESTKAFGLVDFVVIPHYGKDKYLPIQEKIIKEFGEKYKLVPLRDEEMRIWSKMDANIVFISGQGGSGKTTLVKYFKENPVENWLFFDFDEGAVEKPDTTDMEKLAVWVSAQREYWLKEVRNKKYSGKNICLFGVGLFPWKVGYPDDVKYAYLAVDQDLRKDRLISRGDPHLWEAYQKDISDIVRKLDDAGAKRIENSHRPIEETAHEIRDWLNNF